jgi:hypothetical protein
MKKRIFLSFAVVIALALGVVGFSAFEAHVVNVTATIENATQIDTNVLNFGTVFPEEKLVQNVTLSMSQSFQDETAADGISYMIRQKPKCWNNNPAAPVFGLVTENEKDEYVCVDNGFVILPMLCPFLSKHPDVIGTEGNDDSLDAFHGPLTTWTPADTLAWQVDGLLSKKALDISDTWAIDLAVPCFKGHCAQDNFVPEAFQVDPALEHDLFGCDLWFEVNNIIRPAV